MSFIEDFNKAIEDIKASDINGCITGSCMCEADFETWTVKPDIDVFTYGETYFLLAIKDLQAIGFQFGVDGTERSRVQEAMKFGWSAAGKKNNGFDTKLSTVKMVRDGIIANVSYRKGNSDIFDVVTSFDMSIVMRGYDIPGQFYVDLRTQWTDDTKKAVPNLGRIKKSFCSDLRGWGCKSMGHRQMDPSVESHSQVLGAWLRHKANG